MNKLISTEKRLFISLVGPSKTKKSQRFYKRLELWTLQLKNDKSDFFHKHPQPLYDFMLKVIENLKVVQGVNFDIIDSLENSGTKYLLNFDDSGEEIPNSKISVDIATAGLHRGLSTNKNEHFLFHQIK